jgi:hypothetical protein
MGEEGESGKGRGDEVKWRLGFWPSAGRNDQRKVEKNKTREFENETQIGKNMQAS